MKDLTILSNLWLFIIDVIITENIYERYENDQGIFIKFEISKFWATNERNIMPFLFDIEFLFCISILFL